MRMLCTACNGSGEGAADGLVCRPCRGDGEINCPECGVNRSGCSYCAGDEDKEEEDEG